MAYQRIIGQAKAQQSTAQHSTAQHSTAYLRDSSCQATKRATQGSLHTKSRVQSAAHTWKACVYAETEA